MTDNDDLRERAKVEQIDRLKAALRNVPNFWQRFNDWTSDRTPGKPFEICRYGRDNEDEIVVVHACASQGEADEKQLDAILEARAQAALSATPLAALQQRVERLTEALTPSGDTKAAYMGEFAFNITESYFDESTDTFEEEQRKVYVPWTTIKEIMAAISARAALGDDVG